MESVLMFFALGTFGFFAAMVVFFGIVWIAVSNKQGIWALIAMAGSVAFLQFVVKLPVWQWAQVNWKSAALWFVAFLGLGFCHLLARWYFHTSKMTARLKELRAEFCQQNNYDPAEEFNRGRKLEFARFLSTKRYDPNLDEVGYGNRYEPEKHGIITSFDRSKYTAGRWLFWWIWCLFGLLDDYILWVGRIIRENLRGLLNWMSRQVFGDLAKDSLEPGESGEAENDLRRGRDAAEALEEEQRRQGGGRRGAHARI